MKISVKKISELTGFSPATVSNALNYKRGVNRETAELIFKTAREHGYHPEANISKIRLVMYSAGRQVVTDTPFFSALLQGVESECRENGFELTISRIDRLAPDYEDTLEQILRDAGSAILLLATEITREDAERFEAASAPIVFLDCWFPDLSLNAVLINNTDSVFLAVDWLIQKGHRQIGYLKSTTRIENFKFREQGFHRALMKHRLPVESAQVIALTPTMDGAYEDMLRYLRSKPALPTAFFADNDIIALGCMKALTESGCKIPQDVSIIGFDDMPFSTISSPPLTTIRVFKHEMGQAAVRRVMEVARNRDEFMTKTQICTELVVRSSVRDLTADE